MKKGSVAVFGSSQAPVGSPLYETARALGGALARRGATVRCGGYAGTMEAVAMGAQEAGGKAIGCTLSWFGETRVPYARLDELYEAKDLEERVRTLLTGARGAVVLPGGVGTFNELFWVWTLITFDRDENPDALVLLGEPWEGLLDHLGKHFEFGPDLRALVRVTRDPEEAAAVAWGERT